MVNTRRETATQFSHTHQLLGTSFVDAHNPRSFASSVVENGANHSRLRLKKASLSGGWTLGSSVFKSIRKTDPPRWMRHLLLADAVEQQGARFISFPVDALCTRFVFQLRVVPSRNEFCVSLTHTRLTLSPTRNAFPSSYLSSILRSVNPTQ